MHWRQKLHGFYAILDGNSRELATLLVGTSSVLQLRWKGSARTAAPAPAAGPTTRQLIEAARMVREVARAHDALFIVNDRIDVALAVAADGVHLGQNDLAAADAIALRNQAGRPELLVGISTHSEQQVRRALAAGADYLGYGPVFPTATKLNPDPVRGVDRLARAVELAKDVPIVAIGGITSDNVALVAEAGAWAACSIGGVIRSDDPRSAGLAIARAFQRVFDR